MQTRGPFTPAKLVRSLTPCHLHLQCQQPRNMTTQIIYGMWTISCVDECENMKSYI